jgi:hypothetical protein
MAVGHSKLHGVALELARTRAELAAAGPRHGWSSPGWRIGGGGGGSIISPWVEERNRAESLILKKLVSQVSMFEEVTK